MSMAKALDAWPIRSQRIEALEPMNDETAVDSDCALRCDVTIDDVLVSAFAGPCWIREESGKFIYVQTRDRYNGEAAIQRSDLLDAPGAVMSRLGKCTAL